MPKNSQGGIPNFQNMSMLFPTLFILTMKTRKELRENKPSSGENSFLDQTALLRCKAGKGYRVINLFQSIFEEAIPN